MKKAILTLYTPVPDNNGVEKRVLVVNDIQVSEDGNNIMFPTIFGPANLKVEDVQMTVDIDEGIDFPETLPEHIWRVN